VTFNQVEHELVGQALMYMPQGCSPYKPVPKSGPGQIIAWPGDSVVVESAWDRPYLAGNKPLFYARSKNTGEATHFVGADLKRIPG
jgi:hypothetical protein